MGWGWEGRRERGKERVFHPLVQFINGHNGQSWSQKPLQVSPIGAVAHAHGPSSTGFLGTSVDS